jgi:hypothetical protein
MKMDRNINADGAGKYALINVRKLLTFDDQGTFGGLPPALSLALETLDKAGVIQWGAVGTEDEFFLLKMKDRNALPTLAAYADSIEAQDPEFAAEVREMMARSGPHSPWCKDPD